MERKRVAGRFVAEEAEGEAGVQKRVRIAAPRPKYCRTFTRRRLAEALPEIAYRVLVDDALLEVVSVTEQEAGGVPYMYRVVLRVPAALVV